LLADPRWQTSVAPGKNTVTVTYPFSRFVADVTYRVADNAINILTAATGELNGVNSLMSGLAADFRPRRDQPGPYSFWNLALVDPQIDVVLSVVDDTSVDGQFNFHTDALDSCNENGPFLPWSLGI